MVKNIYALTPLQEGMLFHSLYREETTPYFEQMNFNINGDFNVELFHESWNRLIERYDVFRTIFVHKNTPSPKQVVLKKGKVDLTYQDISFKKNQEIFIGEFIEEDKKKYFNLSKKTPLRVTVFKLGENSYRVIFGFHHILMDGWSGGIVFNELFELYNALRKKTLINLKPTKPYSHYIKWLKTQDKVKSRNFWKEYLAGYKTEVSFPKISDTKRYKFGKDIFSIDKENTTKLNQFVRQNGLTLNSVIQTIWGILLAKFTKQKDIIFGATVSGRVDEIEGIEQMVGLFINAIPVRVRFDNEDRLVDIASNVMKRSLEAKNHHYYSLADIQNLTPLKDKLISQLLVFENYPTPEEGGDIGFEIKDLEVFNQTNYDFDITINPSETIEVMFKYNALLYSKTLLEEIQNQFLLLVDLFINEPQKKIKEIISSSNKSLFISSTFTAEPIKEGLLFWGQKFDMSLEVSFSGYNQVMQDLIDKSSPLYRESGVNVILIRFEDVLRFLDLKDRAKTIEVIEQNYQKLLLILEHSELPIPTFITLFTPQESEISDYLVTLYNKFSQFLKDKKNIYPIDFRELNKLYQVETIFDAKTDKIGHIPFSQDYFFAMGSYMARSIYSLYHSHFKVIALDCDNTIWKGIAGEDGALGVKIEGGYRELQEFVIAKQKEGFLIVLNSKNNEADVWEVFEKNSDMLLKKEHIVNSKINWQPKSQNLKEMAKELNLGLNSFIFLDDNPLEITEVATNAPEVLSIPLPQNATSFKNFLNHIWALDKLEVTKEDRERTKMYLAEKSRNQISESVSLDEFLSSLELKIYMNEMSSEQLPRTSQLTNRTNQFNVSTIRRSENDIKMLLEDKNTICWTVNVEDKFGDYGLVGVIISKKEDALLESETLVPNMTRLKPSVPTGTSTLLIDTFLMSCRVLGRGVERTILSGLKRYANENGIDKIVIPFYPTKKNIPAKTFIESFNFRVQEESEKRTIFTLNIEELPTEPKSVSFLFRKNITTQKVTSDEPTPICSSDLEVIEEKSNVFEDYRFDFLDSFENRDTLMHKKFYLPLQFHKAKDRVELIETKIDRVVEIEFVAPSNKREIKLAEIYGELLNIEKIGIDDSFFDLGGHSLLATRLISRLYQAFKIELSLKDIFEKPTIRGLVKLLDRESSKREKGITKAPTMDSYPLSFTQKRVWLIDKIGGGIAYSMPMGLEIRGDLDIKKLEFAFNKMVERHEILRTKLITIDDEPQQVIEKYLKIELSVEKTTKLDVIKSIERDASILFDLTKAPLFRVKVYKIDNNRHIIYLNMNHSISDGLSLSVITKEISSLYNGIEPKKLTLQYKDFTVWQNNFLNSKDSIESRDYWFNRLKKKIEPLNFPTDYPRFKEQTFNGDTLSLDLTNYINGIDSINKRYNTTLFIFLVASIKSILARYTMQEDIVLGYPISGRERVELENQIGFYANTLILRDSVDFSSAFETLLLQIKQSILEADRYQHYPFEKLLDELKIPRDISRSPLFDYAISLNGDGEALKLGDVEILPFEFNFGIAQFDMSFNFNTSADNLFLHLNYNSDLFKAETISRFLSHIQSFIGEVLREPNQKIKEVQFLSEKELKKEFRTSILKENSTVELFYKQVDISPNAKAIVSDKTYLTYQELDELSNRVAQYLRDECSIQNGDRVAFLLKKSLSVIAILAILKVGATFIPINMGLPQEKIDYILRDAGVKVMLTKKSILKAIDYSGESRLRGNSDLNSSAYIIYTSGTTGNPKGVEVSQGSLLNLSYWYIDDFNIDATTKALLMIPTSFDASIKNILATLFVGGEVIITKEQFEPFDLLHIIESCQINLINCVPSAFRAILDASEDYTQLKTVRYLALGGEPLDLSLFRDFYFDNSVRLFNIYGPTEATDISTLYEVTKDDFDKTTLPIGRAITNVKIYIVDKFYNLVPKGVVGELIIAGKGVAKGYINNPELTNKRFITHSQFGRIYKTGDLGRELQDGNIEFLGRSDDQVKIRGNRVELKEIEHQLMSIKEVDTAIVLPKDGRLIAYIKYSDRYEISQLKEYLKSRLIPYMIPSSFIEIESIPLTINGKVDKKILLSMEIERVQNIRRAISPLEESLLSIFKRVLNRKISIEDNFFEVGGDSLNGVKVISMVNSRFKKELKLSYIFEYQTIIDFAYHLEIEKREKHPYSIFNKDKKRAICILPALIDSMDYKITAQKLSKYLSDYKIYAFDFILEDNRIEQYASLIDSLEDEVIFLGYSSGGNLAFEVIKQMTKRVEKLILLDSWKIEEFNAVDREEALSEFKKESLEIDYLIVDRYIEMLNGMKNLNTINSNIDLISFGKETKDVMKFNQNWQNSTRKEFQEYRGFGNHIEMLKGDYLIDNCRLIDKIIKGEKNEN